MSLKSNPVQIGRGPTRFWQGILFFLLAGWLSLPPSVESQTNAPARWTIDSDGGITWKIKRGEAHQDTIEMSGRKVSAIVTYGVDGRGVLAVRRQVVFPMLRFFPNRTSDHFSVFFGDDDSPRILINRAPAGNGVTADVHLKGLLRMDGALGRKNEISLTRTIFPSADKPMVIETYRFWNHSSNEVNVRLEDTQKIVQTNPERGVYGGYLASSRVLDSGEKTIPPGGSVTLAVVFSARKSGEPEPAVNVAAEEQARQDRVGEILSKLQLETPDPVLNTLFAFAKIRAAESIYETKAGLLHSPGGGDYYAAIWANDQAEYAGPFFAYLGDATAATAATNAYRLFAGYMNPGYQRIPSSIISEGAGFWNGAGDRGDMAMIAYGAARFALAYGDKTAAEQLWPLIEWCLEYCHRHLNAGGVVASDSDELENRFPSGKANLCTSSLYFDALNSSVMLGRDLGKPRTLLNSYAEQAIAVRAAIEKYFGTNIEGFDTYRYYDGNIVLRAWICIPLAMGIFDRKEGTINALFSPRLWTPDGLATQAGRADFWDRSTLYALRGVFAAGATQKALDYLTYYSNRRLLGEHVPYPVEAYPEGNQRHLSAESALYCRIYTEGLFGIRPTGLRSFQCTPRLPKAWPGMSLKNIQAFGNVFDLVVSRSGDKLSLMVIQEGKVIKFCLLNDGDTVAIDLGKSME